MSVPRAQRWLRATIPAVMACMVLFAALMFYPTICGLFSHRQVNATSVKPVVTLVARTTDSLQLERDVAERLGIRTANAKAANVADTLTLIGSLTRNSAHLEEIRSRFEGEDMEIAKGMDRADVTFGDSVQGGQLLAVVWSRELGEKKGELVGAYSQLHLDGDTLHRLEQLCRDGKIPERQYRDQERAVENDRLAVGRVLRTLQTWRGPAVWC